MLNRTDWTLAFLLITAILWGCAAGRVRGLEFAPHDEAPAPCMRLPETNVETTFAPSENRANFTSFEHVRDLDADGNRIAFTLTDRPAVLNWGNVRGDQKPGEVRSLFPERNRVQVRAGQSGGTTRWTVVPYREGKRVDVPGPGNGEASFQAVLEGRQEQGGQRLTFMRGERSAMPTWGACADGLQFRVAGDPGTRVELESVTVSQTVFQGVARLEFDLPAGDIWRAVADVAAKTDQYWFGRARSVSTLYINGDKVERSGALHLYHTAPVDIAPYLNPGERNVIGFYGFRRADPPPLAIASQVVMQSGDVVDIQSGTHWRWASEAPDGWNEVGFDDSEWQNVEETAQLRLAERDFGGKLCLLAYKGPIVVENPTGRFLYFRDDAPVSVRVRVPGGLADRAPALAWRLGASDAEGNVTGLAQGVVETFERRGPSLVYAVDLGEQAHGVYVLGLALQDGQGEAVYTRPPEPLMVLRRFDQEPVQGESYTEGMELALEDEIDFTDPDDPHPWHEWTIVMPRGHAREEEAPTVLTFEDLTYRQVRDSACDSGFSYRFEFDEPGALYLMELTYPDNQRRRIGVSVTSKKRGVRFATQAGVGAETGGKFYTTGEMQTLRWIQVADAGPHTIDIVNCPGHTRAAAGKLTISRIEGDLPALATGASRRHGILSERQFFDKGFGRSFGVDRPLSRDEERAQSEEPVFQTYLKDLVWLKTAAENYTQYLRFAGQNVQVIGCYQYTNANTPYMPVTDIGHARLPWCPRSTLAHCFAVNGIDFFAGVEYSQSYDIGSRANNAQVAQGADTLNMVDARGQQRYADILFTTVRNWMHPAVEAQYLQTLRRVTDTFAHLPSYRGVHTLIGPSQGAAGYWMPALGDGQKWNHPLVFSFDDVTMERFAREAGVSLPADASDPQRFRKRAAFVRNDPEIRERFLQWRCDKFTELMAKAARAVQAGGDFQLVTIPQIEDRDTLAYYHASGRTVSDILHDFALDVDALADVEDVWLGRWTVAQRVAGRAPAPYQDPLLWLPGEAPAFTQPYASERNRYVLCRTGWHEAYSVTGGLSADERRGWARLIRGTDWIQNRKELTLALQPSGRSAREALAQALVTGDPQLLLTGFTDLALNLGNEQALRPFVNAFTHLPRAEFAAVLDTDLTTNLAIRVLERDNGSWLYVVNPGFWPVAGTISLTSESAVQSVPEGEQATGAGRADLAVELAPFGLQVFRSDSPQLTVHGYATADLSGPEMDRLRAMQERVASLVEETSAMNALASADRSHMKSEAARIQTMLDEGRYAAAWSAMKAPRFWTGRERLERAVGEAATLPASLATEPRVAGLEDLPELTVAKTDAPLAIDGKLDEPAWAAQPFRTGFVTGRRRPSRVETGFKALYSQDTLYLAIACADRQASRVRVTAANEDTLWRWQDDAVAIFVQPDPDQPVYYQMAFNPLGLKFDQKVSGEERDYAFAPDWKVAVTLHPGYWLAEIAFPLDGFDVERIDKDWALNVYRRFRRDRMPHSGWSWWEGSWHNTERFGRLRFEGSR